MVKWVWAIEFVESHRAFGEGEGGYNKDHEYFGELANICLGAGSAGDLFRKRREIFPPPAMIAGHHPWTSHRDTTHVLSLRF
jgi:hypothetical protein